MCNSERLLLPQRGPLGFVRRNLEVLIKEGGLKRLIQFGLVGLSGVGVNFGTFWVLTRAAHLKDLAALILAIAAATLSNFILNDIWTFRDKRVARIDATLVRAFKFGLVSLGGVAIYYAIYTPLTRFLEVYDLLALAAAIGVGLIWNFSVNVLWTWRRRVEKPSDL
jgi:dolichol-phosphate mannosyltransferase